MGKNKNIKQAPVYDVTPVGSLELQAAMPSVRKGFLYQMLIAFIGVCGVTYSFTSLFSLPIHPFLLGAVAVSYLLLFSAVFYRKKDWKWSLPCIGVVYILALYLFRTDIVYGYKILANFISTAINQHSSWELPMFSLRNIRHYDYYVTVFLAFALFFVVCGIAVSILRKPNIVSLFLVTFPWIELGLFFGLSPSLPAFILLLSCWSAVCAMQAAAYRKNTGMTQPAALYRTSAARTGIAMMLLTVLIAGTGVLVFPPAEYSHGETLERLRAGVEAFTDRFTNPEKESGGGITGGKLGEVDKIVFRHEKALELDMFYQENGLYLKGYIGGVYTGNSWEPVAESDYRAYRKKYQNMFRGQETNMMLQNLNLTYQELDGQRLEERARNSREEITVRNIQANPQYAYVPYRAAYTTEKFSTFYDTYATPAEGESEFTFMLYGREGYEDAAILQSFLPLDVISDRVIHYDYEQLQTFLETERKYRTFVHDVYTRVPTQGNERLAAEAKRIFAGKDNITQLERIQTVQEYLQRYADYSLEAGRLPEGEDFVDYFLYENHKGSCTHFASAAALMLRYAGIPTRYVEGYIVTQQDFDNGISLGEKEWFLQEGQENKSVVQEMRRVPVLDTNAHAWVEVYIDGYGWIPVEFTPGFSAHSIYLPQSEETPSRDIPAVTKPEKKTTAARTTTQPQSTQTTAVPSTVAVSAPEENTVPVEGFQAKKLLALLLMAVALAFLLCMGIMLRYHWKGYQRKRILIQSDRKECILWLYKEIMALFHYLGFEKVDGRPPMEYAGLIDARAPAAVAGTV